MSFPRHLEELRWQRRCTHLHSLGPRALSHFLAEIADVIGGQTAITTKLDEYERYLTPAMIRAAGADRFSVHELRVVPRS